MGGDKWYEGVYTAITGTYRWMASKSYVLFAPAIAFGMGSILWFMAPEKVHQEVPKKERKGSTYLERLERQWPNHIKPVVDGGLNTINGETIDDKVTKESEPETTPTITAAGKKD